MKNAPGLASASNILTLIALAVSTVFGQSVPPKKDIPAIAKAANGTVASIIMSDKDGKPVSQGSGFLISNDGLIVTNYHVIAEGSSAVAKFPNGAFFIVDGVVASDEVRDLAIIKAHGTDFRALALGNSDRVQVGEAVVAIGNPLSLESTVSNGIISGIRTVEELGGKFLQITSPISPGSSGGPLFNMTGEVIGITTMYLRGGENLNFAIPVNDAKRLLLTRSSKLDDLPNEAGSIEKQVPTQDAASVSSRLPSNPTDRDYFQQLYDAGGIREGGFVCFSDNTHSGSFFTYEVRNVFGNLTRTNYEKGVKVSTQQYIGSGGNSWSFIIPPPTGSVSPGGTLNAPSATSKILYLIIEPSTMRYIESVKIMTTTRAGTSTNESSPESGVCEKIGVLR